jgi:hypothetical protein
VLELSKKSLNSKNGQGEQEDKEQTLDKAKIEDYLVKLEQVILAKDIEHEK